MTQPMEQQSSDTGQPIEPSQPRADRRGYATFFQAVKIAAIVLGVAGAAGLAFVCWELTHIGF